jgi:hypothetical protein
LLSISLRWHNIWFLDQAFLQLILHLYSWLALLKWLVTVKLRYKKLVVKYLRSIITIVNLHRFLNMIGAVYQKHPLARSDSFQLWDLFLFSVFIFWKYLLQSVNWTLTMSFYSIFLILVKTYNLIFLLMIGSLINIHVLRHLLISLILFKLIILVEIVTFI